MYRFSYSDHSDTVTVTAKDWPITVCSIKKYPTIIMSPQKYRDTVIPPYFVISSVIDSFFKKQQECKGKEIVKTCTLQTNCTKVSTKPNKVCVPCGKYAGRQYRQTVYVVFNRCVYQAINVQLFCAFVGAANISGGGRCRPFLHGCYVTH